MERMYRAAKSTGETSLVLEWLQSYRKTLPPRSLTVFNLEAALAHFYDKVLGDFDKAKEAMRTTLEVEPKVDHSREEQAVQELISAVRLDLAGIIFSQFRSSADPTRKQMLIGEIKNIPGTREGDDFQESHIGMLIANMLRIMGPTRDYQDYMNKIFKTCIDGLEDSDAFNDGDSLRLLAKLLSSLDGLERDARITISAQFSVLDKNLYESQSLDNGEPETASNDEVTDHDDASTELDSKDQDGLGNLASAQEGTNEGQTSTKSVLENSEQPDVKLSGARVHGKVTPESH